MLERNLQAYRERYPYDGDRVASLLSSAQPAVISEWKHEPMVFDDVSIANAGTVPRLLAILGFSHPVHFMNVVNSPVHQKYCRKIFIIERDISIIAAMFKGIDLAPLFQNPRFEWFFACDPREFQLRLFNILKINEFSQIMQTLVGVTSPAVETDDDKLYYRDIAMAMNTAIDHVYHNYGRIDDSLEGVQATLLNDGLISTSPGIESLKHVAKPDDTALVVGAGPTLDDLLPIIAKYRNNVTIFSVDASYKVLASVGITPDFVTAIERGLLIQKRFYEGLPYTDKAELVAYPVVHPEVLKSFPGPVRLAYRNYSWFAYYQRRVPKGILRSGGNAGALAVRLAHYMGFKRILLAGIDCCYKVVNGEFNEHAIVRSHCKGTGFPEWAEPIKLQDKLVKSKHHGNPQILPNAAGTGVVISPPTYYQWAAELGEEAMQMAPAVSVFNLSGEGLNIPFVPFKEANDALEGSKTSVRTPVEVLPPTTSNALNLDHSTLLKNIVGWKRRLQGLNKVLLEAKNAREVFDAFIAYHHSFFSDNLFVSFIIQNCGKETFELENRWASLPDDFDVEYEKRLQIMKDRMQVTWLTVCKLEQVILQKGQGEIAQHVEILPS